MDQPRAHVEEINGELVLIDPDAVAVAIAIGKFNCRNTFAANSERIQHFVRRMSELGKTYEQVVITVLNVDDPYGGVLAEILMPGQDWQAIRNRGEKPFARGLASREGIEDIVKKLDPEAGKKLEALTEPAVIVMDHGVVEVFAASEK